MHMNRVSPFVVVIHVAYRHACVKIVLYICLSRGERCQNSSSWLLARDSSAHAVCRQQQQQQQFGLAMQDVHFGYTGEREVVGGVSLSVEPGQSIALVGPSGSGKSTILKLLMRLYDVNSGSILLDGIDTRDLQQVSLSLHPLMLFHMLAHALQVGWCDEQFVYLMLSRLDKGVQYLKRLRAAALGGSRYDR